MGAMSLVEEGWRDIFEYGWKAGRVLYAKHWTLGT